MSDPIREDMLAQVAALAELLRATFDIDGYPRLDDGPRFDARVAELDAAIARLKVQFNDFLMSAWSEEIRHALDEAKARRRTPTRTR